MSFSAFLRFLLLTLASALVLSASSGDVSAPPRLITNKGVTRLIVQGRPFLMRAGEINNSSATNPAYLSPLWPRLKTLNLNTVIAPVYWDLIEPAEGTYDFSTVDALLEQARQADMHLVLLWFGAWKNSMSCYAPAWVKRDVQRFPRALDEQGARQEILTPFSTENLKVDVRAFSTFMRHLREVDGNRQTVLMVQVENEIGMIPSPRDHAPEAEAAFAAPVPGELLSALDPASLNWNAELREALRSRDPRRGGTWSQVFGYTSAAEEAFMAWHFARFVEELAAAGKREYPLPMLVNAALIRPGHRPGQYPSAGPLPHLMDIWKAGAPSIDVLAPDIYAGSFIDWTSRYAVSGNPLLIPETMRNADASVNALYAIGAHRALCFSPFGIESIAETPGKYLAASYDLIEQLEPLLLAPDPLTTAGFLSQGPEQKQPQEVRAESWIINATFEKSIPAGLADGFIVPNPGDPAPQPLPSGGLMIQIAPDEFVFAGTALVLTFRTTEKGKTAGILRAEEGQFINGVWKNKLWLSGDQTHQGRHIRLEPGRFSIQRVKLYTY